MNDDEIAIRGLVKTWMEASRAGDTQTVLDLMTDDVVFMVSGTRPFGKEAYAIAANGMDALHLEGRDDILELKILGDWAYMRSYIQISAQLLDGQIITRHSYTLSVLQKGEDGRWRLSRDANLLTM